MTDEQHKAADNELPTDDVSAELSDVRLRLKSGEVLQTNSQMLINRGLNIFPGWRCHLGRSFIHIYNDNTVYGSVCRLKKLTNSVFEPFDLLDEPAVCDGRPCVCLSDMRIEKSS